MTNSMPTGVPQIETERLILRIPRIEDFDRYAEMLADEEAARHIGGTMVRVAAWRRFLQMPGAWSVQGFAMFSVIDKRDGRWLGQCGPWQPEGWPGTEVGWSFHPDAWGRGYATEAAVAAMDWAFEQLSWITIIHGIDPGNSASQNLARRLGSRILNRTEGVPPFEGTVIDIWGQTREEWATNRESVIQPGRNA
jgi:RimJ/RimL family protein N-acetyltransferase